MSLGMDQKEMTEKIDYLRNVKVPSVQKELQKERDKRKDLESQLAEARELTNKFIKRTEAIIQSLAEDGSEEGHSEFFYRMNSKEQVLHEGFLRKLKQLKEKGDG